MALRVCITEIIRKNAATRFPMITTFPVRYKFKQPGTPSPDPELISPAPKTKVERAFYPKEFDLDPPKGQIYDKKPFRIELEAGKKYAWCTCGHSHKQPFCDGRHKTAEGSSFEKTTPKFRPHRFTVEETKDYWLCNCKQTNNAPFCDGTHKREDIQQKIRS